MRFAILLTLALLAPLMVPGARAAAGEPERARAASLGGPLYVDASSRGGVCSDSRPVSIVTNAVTPWCSIAHALAAAPSGSVVMLRGGSYGRVDATDATGRSDYVTFRPYGTEQVSIDGMLIANSRYLRFAGISFTHAVGIGPTSDHIQLLGNVVSDPRDNIAGVNIDEGSHDILLQSNYITAPHGSGINFSSSPDRAPISRVAIRYNRLTGLGIDAMQLKNFRGVRVQGNEIDHDYRWNRSIHADALQTLYGGSGLVVSGNLVHDTDAAFLINTGVRNVLIQDNILTHIADRWAIMVGDVQNLHLVNNTVMHTAYGVVLLKGITGGAVVANNIFPSLKTEAPREITYEDYNYIPRAGTEKAAVPPPSHGRGGKGNGNRGSGKVNGGGKAKGGNGGSSKPRRLVPPPADSVLAPLLGGGSAGAGGSGGGGSGSGVGSLPIGSLPPLPVPGGGGTILPPVPTPVRPPKQKPKPKPTPTPMPTIRLPVPAPTVPIPTPTIRVPLPAPTIRLPIPTLTTRLPLSRSSTATPATTSVGRPGVAIFARTTGHSRPVRLGPHDLRSGLAFVDPSKFDFRLAPGSAGLDAATARGAVADRVNQRRYDDPSVRNTGAGSPPYGDIGALEFVGPIGRGNHGRAAGRGRRRHLHVKLRLRGHNHLAHHGVLKMRARCSVRCTLKLRGSVLRHGHFRHITYSLGGGRSRTIRLHLRRHILHRLRRMHGNRHRRVRGTVRYKAFDMAGHKHSGRKHIHVRRR